MAKNEFDRWFNKQFGKCPISHYKALNINRKIKSAGYDLARMKYQLLAYEKWNDNYKAARYAYNWTTIGGNHGN
jgi:hypothetical protein